MKDLKEFKEASENEIQETILTEEEKKVMLETIIEKQKYSGKIDMDVFINILSIIRS